MKLKKIHIHNLYSYKDASCEFKDYNIVVGPNGSGKTNLARILNIFYKSFKQEHKNNKGYNWSTLFNVFIDDSIVNRRIEDDREAYLILGIELDDEIERRLFLRMLVASILNYRYDFLQYYSLIDNIKDDYVKDIEIALYYKINLLDLSYGIRPGEMLIRLKNGLTLIHEFKPDSSIWFFTYTTNLLDYINNKGKYILANEENIARCFNDNKILTTIIEKVKGKITYNKSAFVKWYLCLDDDKGICVKANPDEVYELSSDRFVHFASPHNMVNIYLIGQIDQINVSFIQTKPIKTLECALCTLPKDKDSQFPIYHAKEEIVRRVFNLEESILSGLDININLNKEQYYLKYYVRYESIKENDVNKNYIYSILDKFIVKNSKYFQYYFGNKLYRPPDTLTSGTNLIQCLYLLLLIHLTNRIQMNADTLTEWLYELKNTKDTSDIYKHIQEDFKSIFNLEVDVFKERIDSDSKKIYFKEGDAYINLEDSASGYLQLLQTLTLINTSNSLVILDEPASSLHPTTIKRLAKDLKEKYKDKQVILITHSPYFLDYDILFKDNTQLLYITKEKDYGSIIKESQGCKLDIKIKPHLFRPEIFFAKCVILVEGATDESVIRATAEILKNKTWLEDNNISIIQASNNDYVVKYTELCKAYGIKYVALIDKDKGSLDTPNNNMFYACNNLEEELIKICKTISLDRENDIKRKDATEDYEIVYEIYEKGGKNVPKDSVFGKLLDKVEELIK